MVTECSGSIGCNINNSNTILRECYIQCQKYLCSMEYVIVEYDASADLQTELFAPLKEIEAFKEACTVMNGTLAWDLSGNRDETNCIDIDPFTLYELDSINNLIA